MKILIVEDEHHIANSLKKGLEQERMIIDLAYDGETGLDLALSEEYDLIILDLMLPLIDGTEICHRLRSGNNHTPILMLTAKGQIEDKVMGLNSGADDYLTKPFAFAELLARVKALCRRPGKFVNSILSVADLELNTQSYEVRRSAQLINLSHKEFSLLEYLMRHPNRIVSKEQIINHVWDYDSSILPNTIEVYIKNLRRKIDQPFSNKPPLIQTVRGFGYKIGTEK